MTDTITLLTQALLSITEDDDLGKVDELLNGLMAFTDSHKLTTDVAYVEATADRLVEFVDYIEEHPIFEVSQQTLMTLLNSAQRIVDELGEIYDD